MKKLLAILGVYMFSMSLAHANIITQQHEDIVNVPDNSGFGAGGFDFVAFGGTFNQFNPALGHLTNVTISFSGNFFGAGAAATSGSVSTSISSATFFGFDAMIPKKRQHQLLAPWAGEQSRMPWHAGADC